MKPIRTYLVDDQALFREGLSTLLGLNPRIKVVGEADCGEKAVADCPQLRPEIVLMDLRMPGIGGVEATRRLRALLPETRVLILTTFEDDEEVFAAVRAGASGYLLKASPSEKLVEAICSTAAGGGSLEPSVAAKLMGEFNRLSSKGPSSPSRAPMPSELLSSREQSVLRCLAEGLSNKEIASKLGITEGTVKNHMTQILSKLGVLDRTQAALRAREMGLL